MRIEKFNETLTSNESNLLLRIIWILDKSLSMSKADKMGILKNAIFKAIAHLYSFQEKHPILKIENQAITFSDDAEWIIKDPLPIGHKEWPKIGFPSGYADFGKAFDLLNDQLRSIECQGIELPIIIILVTASQPTIYPRRSIDDFLRIAKKFRTMRFSVSLGVGSDLNLLEEFSSKKEMNFFINTSNQIHTFSNKIFKYFSKLLRKVFFKEGMAGSSWEMSNDHCWTKIFPETLSASSKHFEDTLSASGYHSTNSCFFEDSNEFIKVKCNNIKYTIYNQGNEYTYPNLKKAS